jgi:hypothetical protein
MRRIAIDLFFIIAIGVVLGLLAPFGSAGIPAGRGCSSGLALPSPVT